MKQFGNTLNENGGIIWKQDPEVIYSLNSN